jgi:hypothetical protein
MKMRGRGIGDEEGWSKRRGGERGRCDKSDKGVGRVAVCSANSKLYNSEITKFSA